MRIILEHQDIVNALCIVTAIKYSDFHNHYHHLDNTYVEEINHDNIKGFSANVVIHNKNEYLKQQDMINYIGIYLSSYHNFKIEDLLIEIKIDNGNLIAEIEVE